MHAARRSFLFAIILLPLITATACDGETGSVSAAENIVHKPVAFPEAPLENFRKQLLQLAFDTATMIPLQPHIKDRSKAQENIVAVCLELDQPELALQYLKQIKNWRRGNCYANLAHYYAAREEFDEAEKYLAVAATIAETDEDWRKDRIRVRIAQTYALMGHAGEAERFGGDVVESETGKLAQAKAAHNSEESFDEQAAALDDMIETGNFDILNNSLRAYARLFERYYEDPQKRRIAEEKIKSSWDTLPIYLRMELIMEMAGYAIDHLDTETATRLIDEAQAFVDDYDWPLQNHIEQMAKLIKLRHRAGDSERAREDAEAMLALYKEEGQSIVNIWRAGALRPLAEAFQAIGETNSALVVYRIAVEEGVENPNSRPRAEDLSATCASMAVCGVEPDEELWSRLRQIQSELDDPW